MGVQQQMPIPKRHISTRTVLLIVCSILLTLFAVENWHPVEVWPLGQRTVTIVILISFLLGSVMGWLAKSIFHQSRVVVVEDRDRL